MLNDDQDIVFFNLYIINIQTKLYKAKFSILCLVELWILFVLVCATKTLNTNIKYHCVFSFNSDSLSTKIPTAPL